MSDNKATELVLEEFRRQARALLDETQRLGTPIPEELEVSPCFFRELRKENSLTLSCNSPKETFNGARIKINYALTDKAFKLRVTFK